MRFELILTIVALWLSGPAVAEPAADTYDVLFRTGTLSGLSPGDALRYRRVTTINTNAEQTKKSDAIVRLTIEPGDMAQLVYQEDGRRRAIGTFKASVGNPLIMYFLEDTIRHIARATGGSPFYIRNRVKSALVAVSDKSSVSISYAGGSVEGTRIVLNPFQKDRNRTKMGDYGTLAIEVTVSPAVPGWYHSLVAATPPGPDGRRIYHDRIDATNSPTEAGND